MAEEVDLSWRCADRDGREAPARSSVRRPATLRSMSVTSRSTNGSSYCSATSSTPAAERPRRARRAARRADARRCAAAACRSGRRGSSRARPSSPGRRASAGRRARARDAEPLPCTLISALRPWALGVRPPSCEPSCSGCPARSRDGEPRSASPGVASSSWSGSPPTTTRTARPGSRGRSPACACSRTSTGVVERSLLDAGGEALVVSQFTLIAGHAQGEPAELHGCGTGGYRRGVVRGVLRGARARGRPSRARRLRGTHGGGPGERFPTGHDRPRGVGDDRIGLPARPRRCCCTARGLERPPGGGAGRPRRDDGRPRRGCDFAPLAAATWRVDAAAALPWTTSAALTSHFVLLTTAYRRFDLSLVYPIARVAPVLVLAGATVAGATLGGWQALGSSSWAPA